MSRPLLILSGDTFEIRTLVMALDSERLAVTRCSSSDQLWSQLAEGAPRPLALIADLKAPWDDMRGVFRRFRAAERGRRSPILVLGQPPAHSDKDTIESSGVNLGDFFPPPTDGVALIERLRAIPEDGEEPPPGFHAAASGIRGAVVGAGGMPVQAPTPAASAIPDHGTLQKITPARLLTAVEREGLTGRLELELPDGRSDVFLEKGQIQQLRTRGRLALGHLVVELGMATISQVARLGDASTVGLESLMGAGIVQPHQAFELLKDQLTRWLHDTAGQRNGTFRWRPNELPADAAFPVPVALHRALLDGLVLHPPVPHPLPPQLAQAVPALVPGTQKLVEALHLNAVESRLLRELGAGQGRVWNIVHQLAGHDATREAQLEALVIGLRDIGVISLRQAPSRTQDVGRGPIPRARPEAARRPPEDELLTRLKAELERMEGADPFEILQVPLDVSVDQVRKVFVDLSKQYHPDKLFGASDAARASAEDLFKKIQEAYDSLSDPEKLLALRKMRQAGTDRPITQEDEGKATILARQGQLYLKNRNFQAAEDLFRQAAEMNPLERSHTLYEIWAAYLGAPKDVVKNLTRLHGLIKTGFESAEGWYFFGVMLKANGDLDSSEKAFNKSLGMNPGFLEPQRELRLMELRKRKADEAREKEKDKRGGLFGFRRGDDS